MSELKTTQDALESLTPREAEVLRKRFGIPEKAKDPAPTKPTDDNNDGGSGSVPAPANPPT